jgi:hypothetical protein
MLTEFTLIVSYTHFVEATLNTLVRELPHICQRTSSKSGANFWFKTETDTGKDLEGDGCGYGGKIRR